MASKNIKKNIKKNTKKSSKGEPYNSDEDIKKDEEIKDDKGDEEIKDDKDDEDDYEEELFFNKDSYDNFIKKHNIGVLGDDIYLDNYLHKEEIVTPDEKRITSEIMTLAEYTRVLSERAKQIENGSPIFITLNNETNPIKIAEREIIEKKCPMMLTRKITRHIIENYNINEMVIPFI
jgi:DNA-directed RNA polymerase I, II, and III subunit RPABC2